MFIINKQKKKKKPVLEEQNFALLIDANHDDQIL